MSVDLESQKKALLHSLRKRGIKNEAILTALETVPRELFLPTRAHDQAYHDCAIPLKAGQSVSQPYVIALMLQHADLQSHHRVLEVGAGTGYVLALLEALVAEVYGIELDAELVRETQTRLQSLDVQATICAGNGFDGWPEHAPYDRIIVSAAAKEIPRALVKQLTADGKMILPFGDEQQELIILYRDQGGLTSTDLGGVRFVELQK